MKAANLNKQNIILIGFMGVGKGTIARELAKRTKLFAIDTDDLIESLEKRKIKEIFAQEGEEYFRTLEEKTAKWLQKSVQRTIISTGGGFFKVTNLHKIGTVVYLESSFEAILARINSHPNAEQKRLKRPLLQDIEAAKQLHQTRSSQYALKADITIDVANKTPQQIVASIKKAIKKRS
ncbi:MAG: shikimate kinase [Sulfurospirillum sp.]|nr:shikimate kinase [Sulfurospirillum sp.]